ncbi:MAG TPA: hypothetical protein VFL92_05115, partial [Sphingomonas sp.]|nr:hypothetical protein [Sphingomonas sp.]
GGFDHGVGFDTFLAGQSDPWQTFIDNDLVSGLLFAVSWMIFREKGARTIETVAWVWMVMWWGNIVVAIYVLRALAQSDGDWRLLLLGRRAGLESAPQIAPMLRLCCAAGALAVAIWLMIAIPRTGFAAIPTFGYLAGFLPVILSLALIALPRPAASQEKIHVGADV